MQNKIKELKDLGIARELAMNFDYVPNPGELEDAYELLTNGLGLVIDKNELLNILNEYSGNSDGNIESIVFDLIEDL